ncbi:porin [Limnohabitans sp.]|uniref:porin n=1 Tax=Limnohabitans sp. TaxID=1907725 RepID=UPI0025BEA8C4|nr:porin [Limnohabitans sp.]
MKKTLIALAVLAASGAAMAQSSVTIYGTLDVGYGKLKGGKFGLQNGETYGLFNAPVTAKDGFNSTSVIGFRGVEDLGGGLQAKFNLQTGGFDMGTGGTPLAFSREANVALAGGFGEVQLGRSSSIAAKAMGGFDLNGTSGSSALANAGVSAVTWYGSSRRSDQLQYTSPTMGGVTARLGVTLKGDAAANGNLTAAQIADNKDRVTAAISFANGPLAIAAVVETKNSASANRDAFAIGASYDLGVAKIAAAYNQRENKNAVATGYNQFAAIPGSTYGGAAVGGGEGYSLGVSAPIGAMTVGAQYANNSKSKVKATELFANYALSKRTRVYVDYVTTSGTNAVAAAALSTPASTPAAFSLSQGGSDAVPAKTGTFGFGVVHSF